jgi:hypothetical protein
MKKYEGGGLAEAEEQMMGERLMSPYAKKKKPLPGDDISTLSKAPRPNLAERTTDLVKRAGKRLTDNVMGTKAQREAAEADEKRRARANPEGNEAKFRKMMDKDFKKGGMVSSASKRADGCATKGKTKGRMV